MMSSPHPSLYSGVARLIEAASVDVPEMYRDAHAAWVEAEGKACELEEMLPLWFARRCKMQGDLSIAAAEREVKASQEMVDVVEEKLRARREANAKLGEKIYWDMKFRQWEAMRVRQEAMAA